MSQAVVILADGFEEIEAVTIIDVLRRGGVEVTCAGLGARRVTGSHQIAIEADVLLHDVAIEGFDALVLPGGPASKTLREDARVQHAIRAAAGAGRLVAAVCAAPTALDAAGVLVGRKATAYPGSALPSARLVVEEPVVDDGPVVTGRGPATSMAFALRLVERLRGADVARATAEKLLFTSPW